MQKCIIVEATWNLWLFWSKEFGKNKFTNREAEKANFLKADYFAFPSQR